MSGRVLLVEDDEPIRRYLRVALQAAGYEVLEVSAGRHAVEAAATRAPDLVIVDLGLPDMDGKAVIAAVRAWSEVPILVLTARDGETEKIAALDGGADDYVTKPFATGEMLARLRALLRKRGSDAGPTAWNAAGIDVDLARHRVERDGVEVKLTRKEFDVLALLVRHAGRVVTHRQLLGAVWGPAHLADAHYLRIVIGHLRDKLGDDAANPRLIFTEPGVGYRLAV